MEEKRARFTKMFEEADSKRNSDGKLTPVELKCFIKENFGQDVSDKDLAEMFSGLDKNKDGKITKEEFVNEMLKPNRKQTYEEAFRKADADSSGSLTVDEVSALLADLGESEESIKDVFKTMDLNTDGVVSYNEFMQFV